MRYRLLDVCEVIRSKNAGPYELTFDMIFREEDIYRQTVQAEVFNRHSAAELLGIPESRIIKIVNFAPARAIKITICRGMVSGDIGESDIYGAQQHGALLDFEYEI